jgi:SAM-dependent methyltransferase
MPRLEEAFRTGAGVPYEAYPDGAEVQASLTRPPYTHLLVPDWLPSIPDVLARLRDERRPARVLDVGCGDGWAVIELAKAFPHLRPEGVDSDEGAIARAKEHAAAESVVDRVRFERRDATTLAADGEGYDVVFLFECLHDMGRPVEVLDAVRRSLAPGGTVVVVDERVGDTLSAPGDPLESFFSAVSVVWCLPQSRVVPDCEAPGTVMRPGTLRELAERAGYSGVEELAVEYAFWRFYRLIP